MTTVDHQTKPTAAAHAASMQAYLAEGARNAMKLGNRGPLKLDQDGRLASDILDAYWRTGFYVFEGVIGAEELADLRSDLDAALAAAPPAPDPDSDPNWPVAAGGDGAKPPYRYSRPLSDPLGGTGLNNGRHPVKMTDPTAAADAPEWTVNLLDGNLCLMDACVRLYGHPGLLAAAEAVNGADFVPYNEVTFIKEPGLGPSVSWHQDGTTHWDADDWDEGAHGFNFMAQLYPSTPANCVWSLPGSHKLGKVDIKALVRESGSERLEGAVPMMCDAGDVIMMNRQVVHGSFANTSPDRRVTLNEGFFPRRRVLDVTTTKLSGEVETYTAERIRERSRLIQLGINARSARYPHETPYGYAPFIGEEHLTPWNEASRDRFLKRYNAKDMFI